MRKEVSLVLEELREACRRPLFQEIALFNKSYAEQQRRKRVRPPQKSSQPHHQSLPTSANDAQLDAFETASQASSTATSAVFAARLMNIKRNISGSSLPSPKMKNSHHSHRKRRWDELVQDVAKLSPHMTHAEHGLAARLVSILLLGYLLPHSTGNEFFLTQHAATSSDHATKTSTASPGDKLPLVLELPLEERLEHASLFYTTTPTPQGRCTDAHVDLAFWVFLQSLSNYLQAASWFVIDHDNVDLLHILAMAIEPAPTTASKPTSSSIAHKGIARASQLMQSLVPHSFYLPYGHRRFIVQMIDHDLVLPRVIASKSADFDGQHMSPWLEGAIYHLRASLSTYAISCASLEDSHAAHAALANLTVQTMGNSTFPSPDDEWTRYLARMVDDRGHHGCSGSCFEEATSKFGNFCPHAARGRLLDSFFCRIVQQSMVVDNDHDEEGKISLRRQFITHALSSVADAVEWQVECWTTPSSNEKEAQLQDSPCLLASLLHAARSQFHFLRESANTSDEEEDETEEDAAMRSLLHSAIQLIHHPDRSVVDQSSLLVSLAFSRDKELSGGQRLLLESIKCSIESQVTTLYQNDVSVPCPVSQGQVNLISVAARQSRSFATSLLTFLLSKRREQWRIEKLNDPLTSVVARWVVTICQAQPLVSLKYRKDIVELLQNETAQEAQSHLVAAILSSRRAYFFVSTEADSQVRDLVLLWLKQDKLDNWKAMQIGRHCLISGNFAIAQNIFQHLMQFSTTEKSFLWLSTLLKVAEAEAILARLAAKGIPTATIDLQAGASYLATLQALDANGCFQFLTKVLELRMEFLNLVAALRHFVREMRLTGSGPTKFTRSAWHVQNIPMCFEGLANRHHRLYRQYGLFLSQQSRSAVRSVQATCHFVAGISMKVFTESFGEASGKTKVVHRHRCSGDAQHPLTILTRRLDEMVVRDMSSSVDPMTRAAATLEVLDGVLMAPVPFPRDLTLSLQVASLRLTADPEQAAEMHSSHSSGPSLKVIEAFPRLSFKFIINGSISQSFWERATIPCFTFLCTYKILYTGPLYENDDNHADEKNEEEEATIGVAADENGLAGWKFASSEALVTPISPSGRFFLCVECPPLLYEGNFRLTVRPLLRDIRGGEWILSVVDENDLSIPIRVSRSREMHG